MSSVVLDGSKIHDLPSFIAALAAALAESDSKADDENEDGIAEPYFGWDLHSLQDCLQGGYLGTPPYEITVRDAEPMLRAFGREGYARYCESMLEVIAAGGRGLVREDSLRWYRRARDTAERGVGPTLFNVLCSVIRASPATLDVLDSERKPLVEAAAAFDDDP